MSRATESRCFSILLGTVVLPSCLALVNHALVRLSVYSDFHAATMAAFCLVLQLGIATWVLTKLPLPGHLRTAIYVWCLGLINLHFLIMAMDLVAQSGWADNRLMPAAGLFAGEIGVLCVWGVLGSGVAVVRVPASLTAAWIVWWSWNMCMRTPSAWNTAITLQTAVLLLLSLTMRIARFRLSRPEQTDPKKAQFGMREMLVGTALLAILFTLTRTGTTFFGRSFNGIQLWMIHLAVTSAFCMLAAVWAALGKEHMLFRITVFLLLALGAGLFQWFDSHRFLNLPNAWRTDYERYRLAGLGVWWIGWFMISSVMVASLLLFVRSTRHQLMRR